jgi:RNA methyltransferase, TrmH family
VISVRKLARMDVRLRLKKCAYLVKEAGDGSMVGSGAYLRDIIRLAADSLPPGDRLAAELLSAAEAVTQLRGDELRFACEDVSYRILERIGITTADWDLPPDDGAGNRRVLPIRPYLDRVRSPYNVGAVLRTAEAFCCDRVLVSPQSAALDHPRTLRSARMTRTSVITETADMAQLEGYGSIFALESGGTSIDRFPFPASGTVIVGSEEFGVSPEGLRAADGSLGRVTIPMYGLKGSLNLAVAFGILMYCWVNALNKGG